MYDGYPDRADRIDTYRPSYRRWKGVWNVGFRVALSAKMKK